MAALNPESIRESRFAWLGWAVYLAVSWTWCIGMFLPVLLVRDYGIWGWVVFAVPNVIGAAAMGWVIKSQSSAQQILISHAKAISAFTFVTLAFHWFFIGAAPIHVLIVWLPTLMLMSVLRNRAVKSEFIISIAAICVSLVLLIGLVGSGRAFEGVRIAGTQPSRELLWMIPVMTFGFLMCPYLDVTFLRVRSAASNGAARTAFGVGFGFWFLTMIVVTLAYSGLIQIDPSVNRAVTSLPYFLAIMLAVHLGVQISATTLYHETDADGAGLFCDWMVIPAHAACVLIIVGAMILKRVPLHYNGIAAIELIYRLFMSFYGLIFPAYVWLCMIPGRGRIAPTRHQWTVLAITILVASPMYWMGFIERKTIWLVPGVAVVLLARLFVRKPVAAPG